MLDAALQRQAMRTVSGIAPRAADRIDACHDACGRGLGQNDQAIASGLEVVREVSGLAGCDDGPALAVLDPAVQLSPQCQGVHAEPARPRDVEAIDHSHAGREGDSGRHTVGDETARHGIGARECQAQVASAGAARRDSDLVVSCAQIRLGGEVATHAILRSLCERSDGARTDLTAGCEQPARFQPIEARPLRAQRERRAGLAAEVEEAWRVGQHRRKGR